MKTTNYGLLICMLLLLVPAVMFAGAQKEDVAGQTDSEKISLSVYHYLDQTDKTTAPNFQELVDTFSKNNPDIELTFEFGYGESFHNKLQTLAMSGQLPDIILLYPGKRTAQVTSAGLVKDLTPWLQGHEDEFASMAMQPQGINGEIWEIPEDISITSIMYTNNKLLDQLGLSFPKTMDELLAQGEIIRDAGLIPIAMANKDDWAMQSCFAGMIAERTCGLEWFDAALAGQASFSDSRFVRSLEIIKELHDEEMFSPGVNQLAYGQGLDDFVNERAVYLIDGGWTVNQLVGELTDEQKTYVTLESFPDIENQLGESGSTSATAGQGFGMNAKLDKKQAEAAWKWIWFYSGPEGSAIRQRHGRLPAYNLDTPKDADPMIQKLIQYAAKAPMGYVLDAVIGAEPIGVFNNNLQQMMFGNKSPQQVADELESMVDTIDRGN